MFMLLLAREGPDASAAPVALQYALWLRPDLRAAAKIGPELSRNRAGMDFRFPAD
jgi:hypothetical protein